MTSRYATSYEERVNRSAMTALRRKLVSERGASLSMALLFVTICAVVGFIIISAATGMVGRATKVGGDYTREVLDQRQYVLRSAAQLVRDQIADQCVCVAYVEASDSTKSGVIASSGTASAWESTWDVVNQKATAAQVAIAAGNSPTYDAQPDTALEYLVAQSLGFEVSAPLATENDWHVTKTGSDGNEVPTGFIFPNTTSSPAYFVVDVDPDDATAAGIIDGLLRDADAGGLGLGAICCSITADINYNLTVSVFFKSSIDDDDEDEDEDAIEIYLPATTYDYPEEAISTVADSSTTEVKSTTSRAVVSW